MVVSEKGLLPIVERLDAEIQQLKASAGLVNLLHQLVDSCSAIQSRVDEMAGSLKELVELFKSAGGAEESEKENEMPEASPEGGSTLAEKMDKVISQNAQLIKSIDELAKGIKTSLSTYRIKSGGTSYE